MLLKTFFASLFAQLSLGKLAISQLSLGKLAGQRQTGRKHA
jgi:hypothetical protein